MLFAHVRGYHAHRVTLLDTVTTPISDHARGKSATRRTLLARRDGLTVDERDSKSAAIAARVAPLLGELAARSPGAIVALYAEKGSEVSTGLIDAAAREAGLRVVYPRVVAGERVLAFHHATRDQLVSTRLALREPREELPVAPLEDIMAFVVPGLAFDRSGGRVGWGRGHYDATFSSARLDALRVGVAFDCQVVDRVPREAHDALVHAVASETALTMV